MSIIIEVSCEDCGDQMEENVLAMTTESDKDTVETSLNILNGNNSSYIHQFTSLARLIHITFNIIHSVKKTRLTKTSDFIKKIILKKKL